jgi:hypothetical protein
MIEDSNKMGIGSSHAQNVVVVWNGFSHECADVSEAVRLM